MNIPTNTAGVPALPIDRLPDVHVTREEADRVLRGLARARAASDYQLCQWLACGFRLEVHRSYGYADFREYAERVFDFSGRQTEERLRITAELPGLPQLARAFCEGRIGYSVVRELTRVATADTEAEWMARAEGRTAREVERMVSGRTRGDGPSDPARPDLDPMRWGLVLLPANHGLMEQVRKHLIAATGRSLTDDELAVMVAERVLAGAKGDAAEGRAPFQISLHTCESCGSTSSDAGGVLRPVSDTMVAMAECDAQHVGRVDARQPERATQTIPPRVRRMVLLRHGRRCAVPGCRNCGFVHIHHVDPRSEGGTHDPDLLVPLCSAHHTAVHDGRLVIRGRASTGFVFQHADGSSYGAPQANGAASATLEQVFGALTALGFKHKQAQSMIDSIRPHVGADVERDAALRMALAAAPVSAAPVSATREEHASYRAAEKGARAPTWGRAAIRLDRGRPHVRAEVERGVELPGPFAAALSRVRERRAS